MKLHPMNKSCTEINTETQTHTQTTLFQSGRVRIEKVIESKAKQFPRKIGCKLVQNLVIHTQNNK